MGSSSCPNTNLNNIKRTTTIVPDSLGCLQGVFEKTRKALEDSYGCGFDLYQKLGKGQTHHPNRVAEGRHSDLTKRVATTSYASKKRSTSVV